MKPGITRLAHKMQKESKMSNKSRAIRGRRMPLLDTAFHPQLFCALIGGI